MKKISIIIPFFNEGENVGRIYDELCLVAGQDLRSYELEILFLDNHSVDSSPSIVDELIARDKRVSRIRLSRNFGYQANILTGFSVCQGDAAIQLDADGEDDPRLIPRFVALWEEGNKVVYGVRESRRESFILSWQRKVFYRLIRFLSEVPIPVDAGDFRLIDRQVIDCLLQFKESNPYLRGLIAFSGFQQKGVSYQRRSRYRGESKFSWFGYIELALDGITSFSRKPLAVASWIGFILFVLSSLAAIFYLALHLIYGARQPGFTTLIILHLFLAGMQLLGIGLLGAYVGRIFDEVKGRPRAIVEQFHGNRGLSDRRYI